MLLFPFTWSHVSVASVCLLLPWNATSLGAQLGEGTGASSEKEMHVWPFDKCWMKSDREWIRVGVMDIEGLGLTWCFIVTKYIHTY